MPNSYQLVKRQEKLSVQVAEQIIDLIMEGKLKEGDRLPPERELCDLFGVSRTVIREAVSNLEARGLISSITGSGSYISSIRSEHVSNSLGLYITTNNQSVSIKHLLEIRRLIETQVANLAAKRATAADIQALEHIWQEMCQLTNNPASFAEKDLEFHVMLARASGNPLFEIVLKSLTDVLLQLIYIGSELPGTASEACDCHREVIDAIKSHDSDKAAETMVNHLKQSERVSVKGLREKKNEN